MPPPYATAAHPFALLDLPDGRCCVARPAAATMTLVAGSFARLEPAHDEPAIAPPPQAGPVGVYASRDAAELAIQRAAPARQPPLAPFSAWLRGG